MITLSRVGASLLYGHFLPDGTGEKARQRSRSHSQQAQTSDYPAARLDELLPWNCTRRPRHLSRYTNPPSTESSATREG